MKLGLLRRNRKKLTFDDRQIPFATNAVGNFYVQPWGQSRRSTQFVQGQVVFPVLEGHIIRHRNTKISRVQFGDHFQPVYLFVKLIFPIRKNLMVR